MADGGKETPRGLWQLPEVKVVGKVAEPAPAPEPEAAPAPEPEAQPEQGAQEEPEQKPEAQETQPAPEPEPEKPPEKPPAPVAPPIPDVLKPYMSGDQIDYTKLSTDFQRFGGMAQDFNRWMTNDPSLRLFVLEKLQSEGRLPVAQQQEIPVLRQQVGGGNGQPKETKEQLQQRMQKLAVEGRMDEVARLAVEHAPMLQELKKEVTDLKTQRQQDRAAVQAQEQWRQAYSRRLEIVGEFKAAAKEFPKLIQIGNEGVDANGLPTVQVTWADKDVEKDVGVRLGKYVGNDLSEVVKDSLARLGRVQVKKAEPKSQPKPAVTETPPVPGKVKKVEPAKGKTAFTVKVVGRQPESA